jgi:hypothetical protein
VSKELIDCHQVVEKSSLTDSMEQHYMEIRKSYALIWGVDAY